jgi:hypothetical protein
MGGGEVCVVVWVKPRKVQRRADSIHVQIMSCPGRRIEN